MTTDELIEAMRKLREHLIANAPEPKVHDIVHHGTHVEIVGTLNVLMSNEMYATLINHPNLE